MTGICTEKTHDVAFMLLPDSITGTLFYDPLRRDHIGANCHKPSIVRILGDAQTPIFIDSSEV